MDLAADVRYAFRSMRRAPGFFALVIGILSLGIAAGVSVFSIVDAVLLRPFPYRDANRLVMFRSVATAPPFDSNGSLSYSDFEKFRSQSHSFSGLAVAYRTGFSQALVTSGAESVLVPAGFVSPDLFALLGRAPILGRTFTDEETRRREHVLLLSQEFCGRYFGSCEKALGRDLEISGEKWRIIGIMPADFHAPFLNTQLWAPITAHPQWDRRDHGDPRQAIRWEIIARLKPGTTLRAAQSEVDSLVAHWRAADPENHKDRTRLLTLNEYFAGPFRRPFWVLFGSVAFLLLIACANVGNLLLARASARDRELAVRTALGAGRGRLVRQIIVETTCLCAVAGAIGVDVAVTMIGLLKSFAPADTPRIMTAAIDLRAIAFALGIVLLMGITLGLVSAWRASRRDPRECINASGRGLSEARDGLRLRSALVAGEFALAMVLLTGAALFVRSFAAVTGLDLGFRPDHVLAMRVSLPDARPSDQEALRRDLTERIGALPGVQAVGMAGTLFFLDVTRTHALRQVEGHPPEPVQTWQPLVWNEVGGAYFQAMGIPLLRGRFFNAGDGRENAPLVAIVNETAARRYWPGEDPVGGRLKGFDERGRHDDWLTVVGVVKDSRITGLEHEPYSQIFEYHAQELGRADNIIVRTSRDPAALVASARALVHGINPAATISSINTMTQLLDQQEASRRFGTWLIGVFSAIALGLAALGVFAVMHYSVAARKHEIGVRIAVGANSRDILRLVLSNGTRLAIGGIMLGALLALWTAQAIAALLFQVRPADPLSFGASALLLALVSLVACYFPARRAARLDPVAALRTQ